MNMAEEIVKQLLVHCRAIVASEVPVDEGLRQLKDIVEKQAIGSSVLFDVLTTLDIECSPNSGGNSKFRHLLLGVMDELIPSEVLNLELNALEAEDKATKSRIIKLRTRIYYKQVKFNLLHEESEGYAKLIAEVLSTRMNHVQITHVIERLIGQFNLDPNRVVDIILDCFEQLVSEREYFLHILRKFNREELCDILLAKFVMAENAGHTPTDLYRVASIVCQAGLVELGTLFAMVSPTQEAIREEYASLCALVIKRSAKAEVISTGSLADAAMTNYASAMSTADAYGDSGPPEPSINAQPALSFDAAAQSQAAEDRKLAGSAFDDADAMPKNQKLGLLCALLEQGAWELARQLFDYFPEGYVIGKSRRVCTAIANVIGYSVEPFYKLKYEHWREPASRSRDGWRKFTCPVEQMRKWEDILSCAVPHLQYIGPYIAQRHEVAVKLLRLFAVFFNDEEMKMSANFGELRDAIMSMLDCALLPATSLLNCNSSYNEELWLVLQRFTPEQRYRLYGRWKTVHTTGAPRPRFWDMTIQRGRVLGMTKYAMKRLSKETSKVVGRQLGKLCHTFPMIALDYMLDKVQDFQNFIAPVVESMRFLTNLGFDVLSYVLIENLADSQKDQFKATDGGFSPWLISLANFAAAVYRRYSIDFSGLVQYIANQLKDGKSLDLIVLREVVANISGVESSTDLTQDHLEALCGGDCLRQEAGYSSLTKINRKAMSRLRDSLLRNEMFETLCILISQQRQRIAYQTWADYPLKFTTHMLDQSQETFVQFFHFLRTNLKPEEYSRRIPPISQLLTKYHLSVETAMCLCRPVYLSRINTLYETAKKNFKEDGKKSDELKSKLNENHKTTLYKNAFEKVINTLEEELINAFPDSFWLDVTARVYVMFWLLSVNDLSAPISAYEREIEKCRKELNDVSNHTSDSTSNSKRNAKDEERLKALEQKLSEEMRKQAEHCRRIKDILVDKKEVFFASVQNRSSQMLRFLQVCILPRAVFTEVDAVYAAKFIESLHVLRTGFFQTVVFFDKIFTDVTPILAGLTEREANCFGRFCAMSLDLIQRWHSSAAIFKEECEGYPGCLTKMRKRQTDEPASQPFSYDAFRTICYKWQIRLNRSLAHVLTSNNYVLIRNGLTFMTKILATFPIVTQTVKQVEKSVTTLRDNEKGKRLDLNLLAASYLVQLAKRNVRVYDSKDFYSQKTPKNPVVPAPAASLSNGTATATNGDSNDKPAAPAKRRIITTSSEKKNGNEEGNAADANDQNGDSGGSSSKRRPTSDKSEITNPTSNRKRQLDTKTTTSGGDNNVHHSASKRKAKDH